MFRETDAVVSDEALIDASNWSLWIATWKETDGAGRTDPFYAVSPDGIEFEARRTAYTVGLGGEARDPLTDLPDVPQSLQAGPDNRLFVVQFHTDTFAAYRDAILDAGASILSFLAYHAYIVQADADALPTIASLPFVRSVQPWHPAYKLERSLREDVEHLGASRLDEARYVLTVFRTSQKPEVSGRLATIGAEVVLSTPVPGPMDAILSGEQLAEVITWDEVNSAVRWTPPAHCMDEVRKISGGNLVSSVGFSGRGVRAEILEINIPREHNDFQCGPLFWDARGHFSLSPTGDHPTATYGILFGDGFFNGDPEFFGAKGMIPEALGFYASWEDMQDVGASRLCEVCQLVSDHPTNCWQRSGCGSSAAYPYECVLQSNSWTTSGLQGSLTYSAEMDAITFLFDISILQAQGNYGSQYSSGEAWAKNVVSIGGIHHEDSARTDDDHWSGAHPASIGPAQDGRIKPDLAHFYDRVFTTWDDVTQMPDVYTDGFGGTSAATPIAAGVFGLFYQMWHEGQFPVIDHTGGRQSGGGVTVFESRPHATTAKAIAINTARQYSFANDPPPADPADLARTHQGWGLPDIGRTYLLRNQFLLIVDETKLLDAPDPLTHYMAYSVSVPPNAHALRATLAYRDPAGSGNCNPCRVNDVTLRVNKKFGPFECYLGNHGLLDGNWSTRLTTPADCNPLTSAYRDTLNTVENVFISDPGEGDWTVIVRAVSVDSLPQNDGHVVYAYGDPSECVANPNNCIVSSPQDVDFVLVVSVDMDCNQDGTSDADDILSLVPLSVSEDCNHDGVPDECQLPVQCAVQGACCFLACPCAECRILEEEICEAVNGTYLGDGTLCEERDTCPFAQCE